MTPQKITVQAQIAADVNTVWKAYTQAEHIVNWNFAADTWCCPKASNELKVGGKYFARMEAKDGSFGFDFEAVYTEVIEGKNFTYEFGGRFCTVTFEPIENGTRLTIVFDPETENPVDLQQQGWQAILNNFKAYAESL